MSKQKTIAKANRIIAIEEAKAVMFEAIQRLRALGCNPIPIRKQEYTVKKLEAMK